MKTKLSEILCIVLLVVGTVLLLSLMPRDRETKPEAALDVTHTNISATIFTLTKPESGRKFTWGYAEYEGRILLLIE